MNFYNATFFIQDVFIKFVIYLFRIQQNSMQKTNYNSIFINIPIFSFISVLT